MKRYIPNAPFSIFIISMAILMGDCSNEKSAAIVEKNSTDQTKEIYSILKMVKENAFVPDSVIRALNAQHHQLQVLERRTVPGPFKAPAMKYFSDYVVQVEDLPVINPGPGEYVHVMEGQRNGYDNLTIGITETFPNGAPPMHAHMGEESHVLLEGEILYALADTTFIMKEPYIVNITEGVPHAFKNLGKTTANLVVIFPTNVWAYDVLNYFPFDKDSSEVVSKFDKFKNDLAKK